MKVNFLKRLESSVNSFEITMERTIAKIEALERKIRNYQATPDQNPESDELGIRHPDPGGRRGNGSGPCSSAANSNIELEHLELDRKLAQGPPEATRSSSACSTPSAKNVTPETRRQAQGTEEPHRAQSQRTHHQQARPAQPEGAGLHRLCRHRGIPVQGTNVLGAQGPRYPYCAGRRQRRQPHHIRQVRFQPNPHQLFPALQEPRQNAVHAADGGD